MIFQIKSKNKYLLDILNKNPNTDLGLYLKPLKKGIVVGNIIDTNQYDVMFQDYRYSYMPEESNAIDYQSYCSPLVILDIIPLLFQHLIKEQNTYNQKSISWLSKTYAEVDDMDCTIDVLNFYINSSWVKEEKFLLAKYFPQVSIKQKVGCNYNLTIQAKSIFEAINILAIVSVFTHLTNKYGVFTYIDDMFSKKYAKILTNIESVPYFVFYLFIKRTIKNTKQFETVKPIFEDYFSKQGVNMELTSLPTHLARIRYIIKKIDRSLDVLDIGCGELLYYKSLMRKDYFKTYYGVDEDEKFASVAEKLDNQFDAGNLIFSSNLDDIDQAKLYNIIISEVIEHNTIEEAKKLLRKAFSINMNQCIITTPNSDFNKYYSEIADKRHDDHDFELTAIEFKVFIDDCLKSFPNLTVTYDYIGDSIDGCQPTQVAIVKPIKINHDN